jgi:hypothetical protein
MKIQATMVAVGAGALLVLHGDAAFAQEGGDLTRSIAAVRNSLEIGVQGGYAQGTGNIGEGVGSVSDLSEAGGAGEIQLGWRVIPQLTIGVYGTFSGYSAGDELAGDTDVLGATAGLRADWHFLPAETLDPWVSLSTGWRGLWLTPDEGQDTSLQGLELARVQVGLDYRVSPELAISPVVGAGLSMFLSEDSPVTDGYEEIEDPQANVFFFAGLMGRFNVLGER